MTDIVTKSLAVRPTAIPGLLVVALPVHGDSRGWFKENWQRAKMTALGLPDFGPVQHNLAFNDAVGVTRGIHGEPWDKFVSVATGRIFGAWVDLRPGPTYGKVVTLQVGPEMAVYVPRGVGNAYQTLEAGTVYSYLVNDHWSAAAKDRYCMANRAAPSLAIDWPIPLAQAVISEADRHHPALADARPAVPPRTLVLGAGGQLGRALLAAIPGAVGLTRAEADLTEPRWLETVDLDDVGTIVNAAAYTAVDAAETPDGRRKAWATNVTGVAALVAACQQRHIRLVHISSDYVFDGTRQVHDEAEAPSPLGVYGQTKAAGDALVAGYKQHYLLRATWVVGAGRNFVATMAALADRGVSPAVVDDQHGRLTFATDLAAGIAHLLRTEAPFGTYNLSNSGPVQTWADIAAEVFALRGRSPADVTRVSTQEYAAGKDLAPRPTYSTLALDKIEATGFAPPPAADRLAAYLRDLTADGPSEPYPRQAPSSRFLAPCESTRSASSQH